MFTRIHARRFGLIEHVWNYSRRCIHMLEQQDAQENRKFLSIIEQELQFLNLFLHRVNGAMSQHV